MRREGYMNIITIALMLGCLLYDHILDAHAIVFIHLGDELPLYIEDSLAQARMFNTCDIYLLANQRAFDVSVINFQQISIKPVAVETIQRADMHAQYVKKSTLDYPGWKGFWLYTSERFLYLNDFIQQNNMKQVFHLENDVMLYVDLDELMPVFKKYYPQLAAVFDNDQRCIPSFVYSAQPEAMQKLAQFFLQYPSKNDMDVLGLFKQMHGEYIKSLPIIMSSYKARFPLQSSAGHITMRPREYSQHMRGFKSIFDAAAIGQFLGGIDPRHGDSRPGFINESCLFDPSRLKYMWKRDAQDRLVPYASFNDKVYRINNLHIHSKNLKAFSSLRKEI